jgi:hypothetical protein
MADQDTVSLLWGPEAKTIWQTYNYLIANGILIKTILKNIGRNAVKFVKEI